MLMPIVEHLVGKELAGFLKPRRIVSQEDFVDEVGEVFFAGQVPGVDTFPGHVLFLVRATLFLEPIRHFGNVFAGTDVLSFGSGHKVRFQFKFVGSNNTRLERNANSKLTKEAKKDPASQYHASEKLRNQSTKRC